MEKSLKFKILIKFLIKSSIFVKNFGLILNFFKF